MAGNIIALIPARKGSKRVPGKNIRPLNGIPLIVYTIQAAKDSGIFDGIYVSTNDFETGSIAVYQGAGYIERPAEYAKDESPDAEWIQHVLDMVRHASTVDLRCMGFSVPQYVNRPLPDAFAILRPTSPFRTGETIKRAFAEWDHHRCMKAVEKVKQHPHKMWTVSNDSIMWPYVDTYDHNHLLPTQKLPAFHVQNASLEIRPVSLMDGIAPYNLDQPFLTTGYEGFDINTEDDWIFAEELIKRGMAKLPEVK
jgi:CMP-N,N'-diacetyllegionaminic acid synthase